MTAPEAKIQGVEGTKVLVVGGAGFVGSNLVRALLERSACEVWIVDNLLSAERENVPQHSGVRFIEGSITNDGVLDRLDDRFDYVFHLATYHGNQNSMFDPLADHENNTVTTLKLYERIKDFGVLKKVVYASAGCTVAEKSFDEARPTTEDASVSLYLDTPYQISKIVGEFYSNYYFLRHGFPVVKARFQNVYGPGEILGAGRWRGTAATVWRNVVPTFVYKGIKQLALPVENGGVATRDFIYVDDIVRGLILCAIRGRAGDVYNLASGVETSVLELASLVNDLTGNPTPMELEPKREWDRSGKRFGSTEKARREIEFEASIQLNEGLDRTIEWTKESLDLIERCIEKHRRHMTP
jgi:UDP-glucose 4-epimerase